MSINAHEGHPKSVIDRINEIRRETKVGTFTFEYLHDPRYQNASPAFKAAFEQLNIPEVIISETERTVRDLHIKKRLTISISIPTDEEMKQDVVGHVTGIGGRAISSTEVQYFFDLTNPRVIESLRLWTKRHVVHEINHLARIQAGKKRSTLLDALISEGLATHHEEHLDNIYQETSYGHVLSQGELMEQWKQAQPELYLQNYNKGEWFFGYEGKHPVYAGYSLGTAIVEKFMSKHPGIPMSKLVRMPSARILKMSGFK